MGKEQPVAAAMSGSDMQRAVSAEHDARRAIADAQTAAAAQLEAARAAARTLLSAVPGRIERLRARGARAADRALAAIKTEESAALAALRDTALPDDLIEPATAALVARLTGGPTGPSP